MSPYLVAVLIFCLRICDVSIGTVRVIYTIRGQRLLSTGLGVIESFVWIFAISRAFKLVDHPASMIGWALGFGAGTFVVSPRMRRKAFTSAKRARRGSSVSTSGNGERSSSRTTTVLACAPPLTASSSSPWETLRE